MPLAAVAASIVLSSLLLCACGGGAGASAGNRVPAAQRAGATAPVMGSIELGAHTYEFRVTGCNLTGNAKDGIFLRATGTMPDGRRLMPDGRTMLVEVERLTPDLGGPLMIAERATVQFGGFMDKDGWEATASSSDGRTWLSEDMRALDSPIYPGDGQRAGRRRHLHTRLAR